MGLAGVRSAACLTSVLRCLYQCPSNVQGIRRCRLGSCPHGSQAPGGFGLCASVCSLVAYPLRREELAGAYSSMSAAPVLFTKRLGRGRSRGAAGRLSPASAAAAGRRFRGLRGGWFVGCRGRSGQPCQQDRKNTGSSGFVCRLAKSSRFSPAL